MSILIRRIAVSLLLILALASYAGEDPVLDRGFQADALYDTHDIDEVNQLNGNLSVHVPLGPRFKTNGSLEYGFALHYNSSFWDYLEHSEVGGLTIHLHFRIPTVDDARHSPGLADGSESVPAPPMNAGVGWIVTLGELYLDRQTEAGQWFWIAPDGGKHGFFTALHQDTPIEAGGTEGYTRDGTYLRLTSLLRNNEQYRIVHFPSGVRQRFRCVQACNTAWPSYELDQMADPYGNVVYVRHSVRPASGVWTWTITEATRKEDPAAIAAPDDLYADAASETLSIVRKHELDFIVETPLYMHVHELRLASFKGGVARYQFIYNSTPDEIYRNAGSNWGVASDLTVPFTSTEGGKIRVHLLRNVILPANAGSWNFGYYDGGPVTQPDDPETADDESEHVDDGHHRFTWSSTPSIWWYWSLYSGRLATVRYPTGGTVQYRYGARDFPRRICYEQGSARSGLPVVGVIKRQRLKPNGDPDPAARWLYYSYSPLTALAPNCQQNVETFVAAMGPAGETTVSYFSTFLGYVGDVAPWDRREFGLPFSKAEAVAPGDDRYISTQTYQCDQSLFATKAPADPALRTLVQSIVARMRPSGGTASCGNPIRSTYVRFDHSGLICDESAGARSCFAANRRLAREHVVYHDDNNSYADTDWSDFDGVGHFRTQIASGSGFANSNPRTETVMYNPGSNETNLPSLWLLDTYTAKRWDENNRRAMSMFQFQPATGFLNSQRNVKGTGVPSATTGLLEDPRTDPHDVLLTWTRRRSAGDGTTVEIAQNSYGGDLHTVDSAPEYQTLRKLRYGSESHFEHATASGPVLHYDREIDPSTGAVKREAAGSGLAVASEYDDAGRLTKASFVSGTGDTPLTDVSSLGNVFKAATGAGDPDSTLATVTVSRPEGCAGASCDSQTTFIYDAFGRLYRTKNLLPGGNQKSRKQLAFLAEGWPSAVSTFNLDTESANYSTTYDEYDTFGRAGRIKDPDGSKTTSLTYGGVRTIARKQWGIAGPDPNPITSEEYDRHGRLIKLSDWSDPRSSNPALAVYGYDVMGRLASVDLHGLDPAGHTVIQNRAFNYDNRGFLTSETQAETTGEISYSYDSAGHVRSRSVANAPNLALTYEYDAAERLKKITGVGAGGHVQPLKELDYYDSNNDDCGLNAGFAYGKLKKSVRHNYIRNPAQTSQIIDVTVTDYLTYERGAGWIGRKSTFVSRGGVSFTRQFGYSRTGLLKDVTYPNCEHCGSLTPPNRVVHGTYSLGSLTSIDNYAPSITYHPNGLFKEIRHSALGGGAGVTDVQTADAKGRLRPLALYTTGVLATDGTHPDDWNPGGIMQYTYDLAGNVSGVINGVNPSSTSGPEYRSYEYDAVNRLKQAKIGDQPVRSYGYDRWGNLESRGEGPLQSVLDIDRKTNRLTNSAYDVNGNVTNWSDYRYEYDALNAMTFAASLQVERMFLYDANNERLCSIDNRVATSDPDAPALTRETWTVRDTANQVLRIIENANGVWSWSRDYIYRGSSVLASEGPEGTRHFHLDHLGTVRMITDGNRRVVSRHVYAPFGEEISDPDADNESKRFTGQERDNLNPSPLGRVGDLDYMHARFHNPFIGRFLSVDPVGGVVQKSQSWNRYAYARNNPLTLTDPNGLAPASASSDDAAKRRAELRARFIQAYKATVTGKDEPGLNVVPARRPGEIRQTYERSGKSSTGSMARRLGVTLPKDPTFLDDVKSDPLVKLGVMVLGKFDDMIPALARIPGSHMNPTSPATIAEGPSSITGSNMNTAMEHGLNGGKFTVVSPEAMMDPLASDAMAGEACVVETLESLGLEVIEAAGSSL